MSVGLHRPPVRLQCTGPGGNTRTTLPPSSRVPTSLMHFSPCIRLAYHHAIVSMLCPTRRGMYTQAREEYSIEVDRPCKSPLAPGRGTAMAGAAQVPQGGVWYEKCWRGEGWHPPA